MNEEDIFLQRLLTLSSIDSLEDLMVEDKKLTGDLKDVLNNFEEYQLDILLKTYSDDVKVLKKSITDKKKILEESIMSKVNFIFDNLNYTQYKVIEDITSNKETTDVSDLLICTGIVYSYTYKDEIYYFIPDDIKDKFKQFVKHDGYKKALKNDIENHRLNMFYSLGLVPKDLLMNLYLDIGCDASLVNECINNLSNEFINLNINNKEYYFPSNFTYLNTYANNIENRDYIKRSIDLYDDYIVVISTLFVNITKVLKNENALDVYLYIIPTVLAKKRPIEKIVNDFVKKYKLSSTDKKKIEEIITDIYDNIRFWNIGGKTIEEEKLDTFIIKNPKSNLLEDCLNSLNKKAKDSLLEIFETNDNSLLDEYIFEDFIDNCSYYFYDEQELNDVLDLDNKIFNGNNIITSFVLNGYAYLYKDNEDVKVLIPKEIKDTLKDLDIDSLDIDDDNIINMPNEEDYVSAYMTYNGIIYKTELQRLLKENHDFDVSIEELDEIINDLEMVIGNDYYSLFDSNDLLEELVLPNKTKFKKYKIIDMDDVSCLDALESLDIDIRKYLNSINIKNSKINEIEANISILININIYSEEGLKSLLEDINVNLTKNNFKELTSIINKYKNDVPIWVFNGYTKKEVNSIPKEKKVGRNDPCPCGSGKKYKKCCGKNK